MRSRVCELLGIDFPIFAFSHCRDVVAAVSKAGGLGVLGAVTHTADELEAALDWLDDELAGRPYGVDLLIPAEYERGATRKAPRGGDPIPAGHRAFVDDLIGRYEVPPIDPSAVRGRELGTRAGRIVDIALAHPIRLIASALGSPPASLVRDAHERGIVVAALAGKAQHALRHVAAGVDIIVAQGYEAAGHTGEIGTMVIVPEIVDAVAPIPVLAAGGIVTGRQMAAAMTLGAAGVWCGSMWLTTEEAETEPPLKAKLLAADSSSTVRSRSWTGKPARLLRTAWTDEWDKPDAPATLPFPQQAVLVEDANRRISHGQHRRGSGAEQLVTGAVGQGVGQLNKVRPAREVLLTMVEDFVDTVSAMPALLED